MADSPSKDIGILSYSIYCNETRLNDKYSLTYAFIDLNINRIGKATLKLNAGNMDKQTFEETDNNLFKPGTSIRFDVGNINKEEAIFEGYIISVQIAIEKGLRTQMILECRDCAFPSTLGRKNKIFEEQKDSDIISDVLSSYGSVEVDTTSYKHPTLMQYYCTDWDFALSRADANGLLISVVGKKISVAKPKISGSAVLTVTYGVDLISFDGSLSTKDQYSEYEAVSWNPSEQKIVKETASSQTLNSQGDIKPKSFAKGDKQLIQTDAPTDSTSLKEWINSIALKAGLSRYQGKFSFNGSSRAKLGCIIELKGVGERFSGDIFVGSVSHTIEDNEWITEVGMGISAESITSEPDVVSPPASGFLPGIEGLHIGKVKTLNGDPLKENRILIELPWLNSKTMELWARVAIPYASKDVGTYFLPEKGDEVLIGFFNHDPSHPVILGSMYSKKITPPYEFTEKNNIKAIVTREKMKIEFDEEKKIITITTPGKNLIEINDDKKSIKLSDQNKNIIKMDSGGITLESDKDIILKAKGEITIGAMSKVGIKANSDISIKGANITASAEIGFKAKGNAKAEISASGQTIVKGAVVMIN